MIHWVIHKSHHEDQTSSPNCKTHIYLGHLQKHLVQVELFYFLKWSRANLSLPPNVFFTCLANLFKNF